MKYTQLFQLYLHAQYSIDIIEYLYFAELASIVCCGPFIGAAADLYGRKRSCLVGLLFISSLSHITVHVRCHK